MAKGGQFERDFSRQLSLWWTKGERDDIFWRTAGSGARATVRTKKGKSTAGQYGDITATDPDGKLLIDNILFELKNGYPDAEIEKLLNYSLTKKNAAEGTDIYSKWIAKCEKSCKDSGIPGWAIVHKRSGREPLVTFNEYVNKVINTSIMGLPRPVPRGSFVFKDEVTFEKRIYFLRLDTLLVIDCNKVRRCLRNSK